MRILIAGGAGYIGSALIPHLLDRGYTLPKYHAIAHARTAEGEATHRAIRLAELADAPVLPFELIVDETIRANERIAFNAGSLTDSIVMPIEDYRRLASAEVFPFAVRLAA